MKPNVVSVRHHQPEWSVYESRATSSPDTIMVMRERSCIVSQGRKQIRCVLAGELQWVSVDPA